MLRKHIKQIVSHLRTNNYQTLNNIELSQVNTLWNVALLQKQHPDFEIIPVLKGNAYGHGIEQVAQILNDARCKFLAVDGYFEAAKIRHITHHRILVMSYILPENVHLLDTKRCSFVVQDIQSLKAFGVLGKSVRIHLELNTGFNRLGLQPEELPTYLKTLKKYPNLKLEGVMTHLVDADNELDDSLDLKQQRLFDAYVTQIIDAGFRPSLIHIAQTAGSPKIASKHANAIRLGIGLYGINPLGADDSCYIELAKLKPVLELKSTIVKVIDVKKGDTVSYNATFTATKAMHIGVLPLGYYEGLPRELSNRGCVTYGKEELPIIGRICMNHTMVDIGQTALKVGDKVTIISNDLVQPNSVVGMRDRYGLFVYTTITGLSSSIRRRII